MKNSTLAAMLLVVLLVGVLVGSQLTKPASAGPALVAGDPTHWFITNSPSGETLYTWAVTNGTVAQVSEAWIEGGKADRNDPEHPYRPTLRSVEIFRAPQKPEKPTKSEKSDR